ASDVGADIRLVLMVTEDDLDLVVALVGLAVILDRLTGRPHRALAREVGVHTGLVVEHANLDDAVRELHVRRCRGHAGSSCQNEGRCSHTILLLTLPLTT